MTIFGGIGTVSSLVLRIVQLILSAFAFGLTYRNREFYLLRVFVKLMPEGMLAHAAWSLYMVGCDLYILIIRRGRLPRTWSLKIIVIGDFVAERTMLAVVAAAAGVSLNFFPQFGYCKYGHPECNRANISMILGFASWIFSVMSAAMSYQTFRTVTRQH